MGKRVFIRRFQGKDKNEAKIKDILPNALDWIQRD